MLNFAIELPRLLPRDDHPRLRRSGPCAPQPAGGALNEQRARARLHACNEAGADIACGDAIAGPRDARLDTHWTRALSYNFFARDDEPRPAVAARRRAGPSHARRVRRRGAAAVEAAVAFGKAAMAAAYAWWRAAFSATRLV